MVWMAKARYLYPPINPLDLISVITQHYLSTLVIAIRGRSPRITNELLAILTEFEESVQNRHEENRGDGYQYSENRRERPRPQLPANQ